MPEYDHALFIRVASDEIDIFIVYELRKLLSCAHYLHSKHQANVKTLYSP